MPRKVPPQPKTDQINFRFPVMLLDRMERYRDRHPLHPTLTSIAIAAVTDWLDAHETEPPRKSSGKPT